MKHIIVITIFLLTSRVLAQDVRPISSEEAVTATLENSNVLKIIQEQINEAQADFRQSQSLFLPTISASYTGYITTNPLMAFGSKLNQELISAADFNPDLLNRPDQTTNYATKIEVQQPLINVDGFYQRKAAKASYLAIEAQLIRTKDYLALEAQKVYMQLQLAVKTIEVLEKTKIAVAENLKLAQNRFDQGLLQKSDVLVVEVRLAEVENQLQFAKSNLINTSNYLSVLINDESFSIIQPIDTLTIINVSNVIPKLSDDRSDIQALTHTKEAFENLYQSEKLSFLPRLNAFGSYELYDDEFLQTDANGYMVGAQLSWNLFEGSKRFGKMAKSKATLAKSNYELDKYKIESQAEINKAVRMVQDAQTNLTLNRLAMNQSEESLRIRTNRYKEGLEKTTDLLMAESQYAQKQLDFYSAIFQWNYAQLYVQYLSK